jgi:hypothetical protein
VWCGELCWLVSALLLLARLLMLLCGSEFFSFAIRGGAQSILVVGFPDGFLVGGETGPPV